ncbi:MAG: class I SAM-dependent methyltransferase [Chloroflexi bacterium]|nr:class I SAM-dependent methyltransferase [Chloroflexota bacterium]
MIRKPVGEIDWEADSRSFDRVAELYDRFRPGYPEALIETILSTTHIPPNGKILEIGSGTGKATAPFAQRGFSILCLEPGENLAAVAAQKFAGLPVEFETARFENWNERQSDFDLVISAQAFHWVPKEIAYAKAARALKPGGWLALFWNRYPELQPEIFAELEQVYTERAPELAGTPEPIEETIKRTEAEIVESGCFDDIRVERFPWSARYSTREYLGLLDTYSDHLRLSDETRERLFGGIAQVIETRGGFIDKPYLAVLYLMKIRA